MSRKRRGLALLLSLLILPLIALLAFTLTTMGLSNLNVARTREDSKLAVYVAEAGAEEGVLRLKEDITASGSFVRAMGNVTETANVTITNNGPLGAGVTVQAPNGADVPPGCAYVYSVCNAQQGRVRRSAGILCRLSGSVNTPFNYAAFGYESIDLTGNAETDSFDSSNGGTYATTRIGWGMAGALENGGHVGTNGVASGAVTFSGANARVAGRIDIGRNGVESSVVSGTAGTNFLTGDDAVTVLSANVSKPPVNIPTLPNGNFTTVGVLPPGKKYGNIQLSGNNSVLTLGNGVYVFDGLKLSGQAQIVLAPGASAEVYITGTGNAGLDLSGQGILNASGKAGNLTFYGGPGLTSEVTVTGNAQAYYRVYVPFAPVKIAGNGDVFGSVVGKSVRNVGNGKIHYDRALNTPGQPPDATTIYRQRF